MRSSFKPTTIAFIASTGLALALMGGTASAQPQPQTPPPPENKRPQPQMPQQQQQASIEVSDAEVEQFAAVYEESSEIREDYTQQFQQAEDQEEAQKIQREANEEIKAVIEESPLSMERYQEIARATAQDTELRNRILDATEQ